MQYYYGDKNILRALDEAEFWKHHEMEHTTVILLVTPGLEKEYVAELKEFEAAISHVHGVIVQLIESMTRSMENIDADLKSSMLEWLGYAVHQSKDFVKFLEQMLYSSVVVQSSTSSQIVIKHIIRESQYFIGIGQLILSC